MTIGEKQQKINDFLDEFIMMSAFKDHAGKDLAIKVCQVLNSVLDDEYFLPRYYTISNSLLVYKKEDDDMYDRSSSLRDLLKKSQDYLEGLDKNSKLCKQYKGVKRYCCDKNFHYSVEEFYSSALHEIIIYEASVVSNRTIKASNNVNRFHNIIDDTVQSVNKRLGVVDRKLELANDRLHRTQNMLPELLAILGIFVAIITVFFGGFSEITLLDNISNFNTYKFFLCIIVVGHIIIDLIFMFLYMLSRIINKDVSVNCSHYLQISHNDTGNAMLNNSAEYTHSHDLCHKCSLNNKDLCNHYNQQHESKYTACNLFKRLRFKYPYIFFINIIGFIIELGLCILWMFEAEILKMHNSFSGNLILVILLVALIIFMCIAIYQRYNKE